MKTLPLLSLFALLLTATPSLRSALPAGGLPVVGPAPFWNVNSLAGEPVGLRDLKGKVVVVDFWATWCGPCIREIPGYIALQKKYGARGLVIVGLSVDSNGSQAVEAFANARGVNYPMALATREIIDAFGGIQGIPTTFLIDREGNIRHQKVGAMDSVEYEKLVINVLQDSEQASR